MKKLALFLMLALTVPANAQMSKTQIQTQINALWPDNTSNLITAQKLRTPNQNIVSSYLDLNGATSFQCPTAQVMVGFLSLSVPSCVPTASVITNTTGTGLFVLQTSPTLITPNLGVPSFVNLINGTGLPIATGVSGLGIGVATALSLTPGTAGSFVTNGGALGTPSSGTATNLTGLPISTGVSGLGTNVATALGVAVGSAGAIVVNGGVLGTPSSGTLTNATGLPISTGVSGLGTGIATALGVNVGTAGAPVIDGGALGTPSSGVGTNLTALNASNLSSGTVAAARGGAGTITGALKGNGFGVVSQAACADLSNGGTACTTNYSQGTWTPTITTTGTVGTPAYTIQVGSYEQIGRLVVAHFTITLSGWTGSPTGTVEISLVGLPAPTSTTNDYQSCTISNYTIAGTAGSIGVTGFIAPATTVVVLQTNTQTGSSNISPAISGTTPQFIGTCTYHT